MPFLLIGTRMILKIALQQIEKNFYLNIPFENPNYPKLDNLGGYFDPALFNYTITVVY